MTTASGLQVLGVFYGALLDVQCGQGASVAELKSGCVLLSTGAQDGSGPFWVSPNHWQRFLERDSPGVCPLWVSCQMVTE